MVSTQNDTGEATSSTSPRRFAAEIWDAKGLAVPTLEYDDTAARLKNGACETMPRVHEARCCAKQGSTLVSGVKDACFVVLVDMPEGVGEGIEV